MRLDPGSWATKMLRRCLLAFFLRLECVPEVEQPGANHEGDGLPRREGGTGSGKVGRLLRLRETWRPEEHERFLDALLKSVQRHAIET
jgi:hypothetical protein